MRNATVLTTIPGYYNNDLTLVEVDYVPTAYSQTVDYWRHDLSGFSSNDHDGIPDPIALDSLVLAVLSDRDAPVDVLMWVAASPHTAKESLELLKASGELYDYTLSDINDHLALFENLPEVGREMALTGIHTDMLAFPTCLEETSFYWNSDLVDEDEAQAAKERATNPKVIWAISEAS